jgi:hypothetical protein
MSDVRRSSASWLRWLAACVAFSPCPAMALDYTWNSGSGIYDTPGNWTPFGPPGALDLARFNAATTYTTIFERTETCTTFDMTAGNVTFTAASPATTYFLLDNAEVHGANLTISGATHQLTIQSDNWFIYNGSTVSLTEGNDITTGGVQLGTQTPGATSTLVIDGAGSTLSLSGLANLGQNGGVGVLSIQANASASFTNIQTVSSGNAGSDAALIVQTGADATCSGDIALGIGTVTGQDSSFTVTGSGSTFVQSGATSITLGANNNSTSALNVSSGGVLTTGTGLLRIRKTGTLTINAGTLNANGDITVSGGTLTLTGSGGALNWASGRTMTIDSGGKVNVLSPVGSYTTPANAVINISGAGSQLTTASAFNIYLIVKGAQLNVTNGGSIGEGNILIGSLGVAGTVIVDGAGSTLNTNGTNQNHVGPGTLTIRNSATGDMSHVSVGTFGTGTLDVLSGASLSIGNLSVGASLSNDSIGNVQVTGASITQEGPAVFNVGANSFSSGAVTIGAGGTFTTATGTMTVAATGVLFVTGGIFNANGNIAVNNAGGTGANGSIVLSTAGSVFTQSGAKTITLGHIDTGTGKIILNAGTFTSGTGLITVNSTGSIIINGGKFVARGNMHVLTGGTLTLGGSSNNWLGTLDIRDRKLVFKTTAGMKAAALSTLQNQVVYGRTHATGIISSSLPANTVLAVIDNGALATPFPIFGGIAVQNNSILIAPELPGDANVDGVVSFTDFVTLANNFGLANKGWVGGDFDMNGTTAFSDFVSLANNFGQTFGGSSNFVVSAEEVAMFEAASAAFFEAQGVPEPATVGLLAAGMAGLMLRRSRFAR